MRGLTAALIIGLALAGGAMAQDSAVKLALLHDALHLTADQEGAWRDYAAAIAPNPQTDARREATRRMLPQLPTPRRLALIEATMSQDFAEFRRQSQEITTFYGRLSPDQQRIFDRQTLAAATDPSPR